MNQKKIGISFSGGGARGAAHIGVLQALNDKGIFPTHISGASAGSIIAALYADGFSPKEILKMSKEKDFLNIFRIGFTTSEITELTRLKNFLKSHLTVTKIEELKLPLFISATNLNKYQSEIFASGNLINVLLASCAIPILFKPVVIGNDSYVDGGLLNNLPIEPLKQHCDVTIGINICPNHSENKVDGIRDVAQRCFHILAWNAVNERLKKCDIQLELKETYEFSMFDLTRSDELFKIGYDATISQIDSILKLTTSKEIVIK